MFQGLPGGIDGLIGGEHDDFDIRVMLFEFSEQFDSRHSVHADIENGAMDHMVFNEFECLLAAVGHQDLVFVLEHHVEGLARTHFIIDNEQCAVVLAFLLLRGLAGGGIRHGG